jgi:phage gp36-like protein
MYASLADLKLVMDSTDTGTGTAAQLSDAQLTLALQAASNRVSVYAGNVYDSSTPQSVPPDIFHDLTLDLAAFWATVTYLKNKEMPQNHPVLLRYKDAQGVLNAVRDGKLRLDVTAPGGVGQETGVVINRIPRIFTGDDSNTTINPMTGSLQADVPSDMWRPGYADIAEQLGEGSAWYQG